MLIEQLIDQLNITRQQAEGGAGLLLGLVRQSVSPEEFLPVADAIPAISDLIGKAPRQPEVGAGPWVAVWQRWFSGWGALAPLRPACEGLGIDRAAINKIVAVMSSYFREQGGPVVESTLLGIWR